jgi:FADH2 O2-dependent halogenase
MRWVWAAGLREGLVEHCHAAVVGSGFAGTILARVLHRLGLRVVLLERHRHPRFAIGESSTPLAAIGLERLARRYALEDLSWLAAYGRWMRHIPRIRRGLKRGFTFFKHDPGQAFRDTPDHDGRLLVAASPRDEVADSHWLREDVDAFLVQRAVAEGVDYRDQVEVEGVEHGTPGGWILEGRRGDARFSLRADVLIDGSGAGGLLANALPIASRLDDAGLDTGLVFAHLKGVGAFADLSPGPYPDEKAAVHHLLAEGWMYVLPFDHGVVSAGILLRREALERLVGSGIEAPAAIWETVLGRYPSLERQFVSATPVQPLRRVSRVQRRLSEAAGPDWAVLPHGFTFLDPMFSTGIAWSLRGVERLALILEEAMRDDGLDTAAVATGFARYARRLEAEARQMARLLEGAYLAMDDFELFTAQSFLYFATVTYHEVEERLYPDGREGEPPAWRGFLGAGDASLEGLFGESRQRLRRVSSGQGSRPTEVARREFVGWITEAIRGRNVAGLADPARRNLYPVDLDLLVARAGLLGMTDAEMRSKLHLLRGTP